jgi:signal transduction histidine kinase
MEQPGKRVLVVDDKPNNLSLVTSLLRPHYEVLLANNGERALAIARDQLPDLILLDIMMPGMSGFEVCTELKANTETADIPVIFLTARNDSDDFEKAYDIGAVDYTTKPINAKELMMRVKTHLLISEQRQRLLSLNKRITFINEELEEEVTKRTMALSRAKESLERQNADLAQFSHLVSHNLRGPVASALGLTQLFDRKNSSNPINSDVIDRMVDSVKNIDTILKDISTILDLRENIPTGSERFDPISSVQSMINLAVAKDSIVSPANFKLEIGVSEVQGFRSYFEKILLYLLENAIQFRNPDRELHVVITLNLVSAHYELEVKDNGIGIPEVDQERIFLPFKKLSYSSKGKGLGLYLVKTMTHSIGGSVHVQSTPLGGSVFKVIFPLPQS